MAISIDWGTKIVTVPRADLTLVQSTPTEIRELNLNEFRLNLKDLEDSEDGMPFLDTHKHNTEVLLGGIVYARVIEMINGYTITFENGFYAVNLVGANSNVGDVVNVNNVSIRSANSAGLISSKDIEYSSFGGGITVDTSNATGKAVSGTVYPTGTPQRPVDNLADAALIAAFRGFGKIFVIENITLTNDAPWNKFVFEGESPIKTIITVPAIAEILDCEFLNCEVNGVLDGNSHISDGIVRNLQFVDGYILECAIGDMSLGVATIANIWDCKSSVPGPTTPVIDMNGTGIIALREYNGGVKLINYNGTGAHSVDLNSGQVILDTTITGGVWVIRGIGKLIDTAGDHILTGTWNGATIINETVSNDSISNDVSTGIWDSLFEDYRIPGTFGRLVQDIFKLIGLSGPRKTRR